MKWSASVCADQRYLFKLITHPALINIGSESGGRMTYDTGGISVKELLVFVPAAGSAMALSWEVGSFLPIGGGSFMLFSLTEHLLFAVQALPVTLVIAGFAVVPLAFKRSIDRIAARAVNKVGGPPLRLDSNRTAELGELARFDLRISRLQRAITVMTLVLVAFGLLVIVWGFYTRLATIIVVGLSMVGSAILRDTSLTKSTQIPLLCLLVIGSLGLAMAVGCDYSRFLLNNDGNLVDVKIRQVTKKAVLLRSGERGVLLFEPQTRRFSVEKWDVVEGLDWQRLSLYKMPSKDR